MQTEAKQPTVLSIGAKTALTVLLALTASSCSSDSIDIDLTVTDSDNSAYTESAAVTASPEEYIFSPVIDENDINKCKSLVIKENSYAFDINALEARVLDLNFDGKDEVLINGSFFGRLVFNKTENGMVEAGAFAQNAYGSYIDSLDSLFPYEGEDGKYWYYCFTFNELNYRNDNVIGAVMWDGKEYSTEYLLCYGYIDANTPVNTDDTVKRYYQKGWNRGDFYMTDSSYISEEEFKPLWEKYPEAPPLH